MAILTKRRSADATAPTTSDIAVGELALNLSANNSVLYTRDAANNIVPLTPLWNGTSHVFSSGIDGTVIGANTPAAASVTTLNASGDATFGGNVTQERTTGDAGLTVKTNGANQSAYITLVGQNAGDSDISLVSEGAGLGSGFSIRRGGFTGTELFNIERASGNATFGGTVYGYQFRSQNANTRYRSDWLTQTTHVTLNAFDDVASAYMPMNIDASDVYLGQGGLHVTGNATFSGAVKFDTFGTPSGPATGTGYVFGNANSGLVMSGHGTIYDFRVYNQLNQSVMDVPQGTRDVEFRGDATFGGTVTVSAGNEVFLNLPTSAGTAGSLWNDSGTVKVA
jgi:hypothetical protein